MSLPDNPMPSSVPAVDQTLVLSDGRTLGYALWGEPGGTPVLLVGTSPGSRLLCPDLPATLAAGVRLVTVDRPGSGRSDPDPHPGMARWVADTGALVKLQHQGLLSGHPWPVVSACSHDGGDDGEDEAPARRRSGQGDRQAIWFATPRRPPMAVPTRMRPGAAGSGISQAAEGSSWASCKPCWAVGPSACRLCSVLHAAGSVTEDKHARRPDRVPLVAYQRIADHTRSERTLRRRRDERSLPASPSGITSPPWLPPTACSAWGWLTSPADPLGVEHPGDQFGEAVPQLAGVAEVHGRATGRGTARGR